MQVEDVFCSKPRLKILKLLTRLGQLNVSETAARLSINYVTAIRHLQLLERAGIVEQKNFGRTHLFRYNENSLKAKAIQELIEVWERNARP